MRRQRTADRLRRQDRDGDGTVYKEGDFLSIDGTAGEVYAGEIQTAASEIVQVLVEKSLDAKESPTYQMFKQADGLVRAR